MGLGGHRGFWGDGIKAVSVHLAPGCGAAGVGVPGKRGGSLHRALGLPGERGRGHLPLNIRTGERVAELSVWPKGCC